MVRQPVHGEFEHRVAPQAVGVVAVFVAGGDQQHAEADDLVEAVDDPLRRARIGDTTGQPRGETHALFDLAQHQQTAV